MPEYIHEQVIVTSSTAQGKFVPQQMIWHHRQYQLLTCSMHYARYDGDTLIHTFFMTTTGATLQLALNTKTLNWTLQELESL